MLRSLRKLFAPRPPNPDGPSTIHWTVVSVAFGLEAEVIRGRLESEGIPCILQREAVGSAIGITFGPLGETKICVPEEYAEQASKLLDEVDTDMESEETPSDDGESSEVD